ncbi:MAG: phosphotransferase [Xanthomonadales bacterium]|nr:phosphotransferase [Xanthomonadales bacterium]
MKTGSSQTIIEKLLTTKPPAFSNAEVAAIAADHFGLHAKLRSLVSERDQNFRLTTQDGLRYTLKVSNNAEQLEVIDFQNQALLHVAKKDPSFPLPRVIPTLDGHLHSRVEHAGKSHFVRVLSWLEGSVIHDTSVSPALAGRMGQLLARLNVALKGFDHPGSNPPSLWDMKRAASLADLVVYIEEPGLRQMIGQTLDRFISQVKPVLGTLRTQVIHNDMNPGNVLMDIARPDQISGLIDFGDITRSPVIIDLAVAAAYQLSEGSDPLAGALPMIAGYHSINPLQNAEMELLTDMIRTRLITSLLIGSYRAILFPENREYLLISHHSAKNFLVNLSHLPSDEALERIRETCAPV